MAEGSGAVPAVSVIIPTYNRPDFLARALEGVTAQDCADWECLVVDDGSRPDLLAELRAVVARFDSRVRLIEKPDTVRVTGAGASRNRGAAAACGAFLAFCDDDDHWLARDHLSVALAALRAQGAELYFANLQAGEGERVVRADWYRAARPFLTRQPVDAGTQLYRLPRAAMAKVIARSVMSADSLVVSRALFARSGGYWERLAISEDMNLMLRLADGANAILYRDTVVAQADVSPRDSLVRSAKAAECAALSVLATAHAQYALKDVALRRAARGLEAWSLLELADAAVAEGRRAAARDLCRKSLRIRRTGAALKRLARLMLPRRG